MRRRGGTPWWRPLAIAASVSLALGVGGCLKTPPYTVTTVVSGLNHVWDIGFTPDGTMLYTERSGRVSAFVGGQKRLLQTLPDVVVASEAGLMGMAIDPQFASNRQIFVCLASTLGGPNRDVRIVRFRVNASYTGLTDRQDIVTGMPVNVEGELGRHSGCRPRFGPDGYLWVGTGDAAQARVPQDLGSLGGKVLRIDRDGKGAPGNPGGALAPRLWSFGHRNVQGIAFRASDGLGVSTEHGPDRDDEINRLTQGNFGWDPVDPRGSAAYNENVPMTDTAKFPDAKRAIVSSGTPTIAPCGATFVSGARWGPWDGALVVATLKGTSLRAFKLEPGTGRLQAQGITLTGNGRLRAVTQGPDGNLYVSTSNGGATDRILRLTPS
jgi:glucose/arabinose dehydrogenase